MINHTVELFSAIHHRSLQRVKNALDQGAEMNTVEVGYFQGENNALHFAVDKNLVNVVKHLLGRGALVDNDPDMWRHATADEFSTEIFRLLVVALRTQQHSLHPTLQDTALNEKVWTYLGETLIDQIVRSATPAMLSMAIDYGMPLHGPRMYPLYLMLQERESTDGRQIKLNLEIFRILIAAGASFDTAPGKNSILKTTIAKDRTGVGEMTRYVLEDSRCEDVNTVSAPSVDLDGNKEEQTALAQVLVKKYPMGGVINYDNIMRQLFERNVDLTLMSNGRTPLFIAVDMCRRGGTVNATWTLGRVQMLLQNMTREQVRMKATVDSHSLVVQSLDLNTSNAFLQTLLQAGADPSAADGPSGMTPLFMTIERSLQNPDDPYTARMSAYHIGLLLDAGADVHTPNTNGYTIADLISDNISRWTMGRAIYRRLDILFNSDYISRREAVGMVLHRRLGGESRLRVIPDDVMLDHIVSKMAKTIPSTEDVFDLD
jgi:hypothetical protein